MSSSSVQTLLDREGCGLVLNKTSLWFCKKAKLSITEIRYNVYNILVLDIKTWYFSSFGVYEKNLQIFDRRYIFILHFRAIPRFIFL